MIKKTWIAAATLAALTLGLSAASATETFAQWLARHGVPAAQQGPEDDPAGDGIGNAIKYALDLDPMTSARDGLPVAEFVNLGGQDRLALTIPKNPEARGAEIVVEASSDLSAWSAEEVEVLNETSTVLEVADTVTGSGRRFLRLQVNLAIGGLPDAFLYVAGGRTIAVSNAKNWDIELDLADTTASYSDDPNIGSIDARSILIANVDLTERTVTNWRRASSYLPAIHPEDPLGILHWSYIHDAVNYNKGRIYVGPATYNGTVNEQEDGSRRVRTDIVVWADIDPETGGLGEFSASPRLPNPPGAQGIAATAIVEVNGVDYFYVLGGSSDSGTTATVSYAAIDAGTGAIGTWQVTDESLPSTDWFNAAIGDSGRIIHSAGNLRGVREVDWATPTSDGNLGWDTFPNWQTVTYSSGGSRWDQAMLKAHVNGQTYTYLVGGGTSDGTLATVNFAQLSDGAPGAWAETEPLPAPRRRLAGAALNDMLVIPGGSTTGSYAGGTDTVFIGTVGNDGEVAWSTSDTLMFQYRTFHGATMAPAGTGE